MAQTEIEAEFNRLAQLWRAETRMLSSVTQKSKHPAYQRIIGMRICYKSSVVPLILRVRTAWRSHSWTKTWPLVLGFKSHYWW